MLLELFDELVRGLKLLRLVVKAFKLVTADAAARPIERLAPVQDRGVLRPGIGRMTLLAAGLEIVAVIERPEPVFISPVRFLNAGNRAAVPAVTRRASKPVRVVDLQKFELWVAGERRVVAPGQAQIRFGQCHRRRHKLCVHSEVARLAAVHQPARANVVQADVGRIDVDLVNVDRKMLNRTQEASELFVGQASQLLLFVFIHLGLEVRL